MLGDELRSAERLLNHAGPGAHNTATLVKVSGRVEAMARELILESHARGVFLPPPIKYVRIVVCETSRQGTRGECKASGRVRSELPGHSMSEPSQRSTRRHQENVPTSKIGRLFRDGRIFRRGDRNLLSG